MSINVNKDSYLPDYNSFEIFGQYKLPFIILLVVVIAAFIFLFSMFTKVNNTENSIFPTFVLEIILWGILFVVVVLNFKWLRDNNYSFSAEIKNLFNDKLTNVVINSNIKGITPTPTKKDISGNAYKCSSENEDGEVFHVTDNKYTYSDAKEICKSLNARLATYDEVEDAYKNGANWCSYGWSDEQMALFPIQKSVYNELKKIKGHQHDCGRPGINGGYISNENSTFGVNCYGKKPYITEKDKEFMDKYSYSPGIPDDAYNSTDSAKEEEEEDIVDDLLIAPFNKSKWSLE
jgi:hypothetical protein